MGEPSEDYLACVRLAGAFLDDLQEYGIAEGDAPGLLVLHGLAMYARDTARAATTLWRDDQVLAAGALTRMVIEHAVLAQWVKDDPEERGQLFLRQSEVEHRRWFEVVLAANFDTTDPANAVIAKIEEEARGPKPKTVAKEFDTPKNLFGDTDLGRQMYLTYRNLSRFVHPSVTTFGRYTSELPCGRLLTAQLQLGQNPEAVAFYLATATLMCVVPYFEVLGEPEGAALVAAATLAEVPTTLVAE